MALSLIVVSLGAVISAISTGVLAARCMRTSRLYLIAWTLASFGLTVGLGAQAVGYLAGYSALIFRVMELGAQALAPLALCLGLTEVVARTVAARFAMRLTYAAIAAVVVVVLGTDPLTSTAFSKSWPDPTVTYGIVPVLLIGFLAGFTAVVATGCAIVASNRSANDRSMNYMERPTLVGAVAALAAAGSGLSWLGHHYAGISLPLSARSTFALTCTLAAVMTWVAATTARRRGIGEVRPAVRAGVSDAPYGGDRHDEQGGSVDDGRYYDYRDGRYDARGSQRRGAAYGYGDDEDWRGAPGSGHQLSDTGSDIRYPALAALVADYPEPQGGFDARGRHADAGRYGDAGRSGGADYGAQYGADGYAADSYGGGRHAGAGPYGRDGRYGPSDPYGNPEARRADWGGNGHDNNGYDSNGYDDRRSNGYGDTYDHPHNGNGRGAHHRNGHRDRYGQTDPYGEVDRYDARGRYEDDGPGSAIEPYRGRDRGAAIERYGPGGNYGDGRSAQDQLFGQILIYTLIEDRLPEFDQLTERMVAKARKEPGTLAYIVHAVPTAPMQRILYEVYRDRAAYDEHMRQPYVMRYEQLRRQFIVATNAIELGLQQATVSPFPSMSAISDILSESGIDLTGVTSSARGNGSSRGNGQRYEASARPEPRGLPAPPPPDRDPRQYGEPRYREPDYQPGFDYEPEYQPGYETEYQPGYEAGYERPYQGWDDLRGGSPPYR